MNEIRTFWNRVPTSLVDNSAFRRRILDITYGDRELQREAWIACSRDIVFFINAFCWILEARDNADWQLGKKTLEKQLPFILRDYQKNVIDDLLGSLGREDIIVDKSRETGVTWILIAVATWDWMFHGQTHIGFVSKDEDAVASEFNPDSLFNKVGFILRHLPTWMRPKFEWRKADNVIKNVENDSTISGYAATGEVARGGRKRWMLFDEFHSFPAGDDKAALDSSSAVTYSRVFVSTPNRKRGTAGAYYDLVTDDSKDCLKVVVDWKDDKEKRVGLYHSERINDSETFTLVINDEKFWNRFKNDDGTYRSPVKKGNYEFKLDGKTRSLYYDAYCKRPGVTARSVASELDRNFAGAAEALCDLDVINRAIERAKEPTLTGELFPDPTKHGEWIFDWSIPEGSVKMWCDLKDGRPPVGEYAAGQDISAGTAGNWSSYSAFEVFDKKTGEHVFEWRSNRVDPIRFAGLSVWLCQWFWDAFMIPEINGPLGTLFIQEVINLHYPFVCKRKKAGIRAPVVTDLLGYYNPDRGLSLLSNMEGALRSGRAHAHSKLALREMTRYVYGPEGTVLHTSASSEEEMSGKGKAHGDAAIAMCCGWYGVGEWPATKPEEKPKEPKRGSYHERRQRYEERNRRLGEKSYWQSY